MVKTITDALNYGYEQLKNNNIESFLADSLILLCYTLDLNKTSLLIHKNDEISISDFNRYKDYIELRCKNMPVKYITGICEFMSLDFIVNENVLIPRPDTEILVEEVIKDNSHKNPEILDLCAGSGCIGISLAHYIKDAKVTLVDISDEAIDIINKNIEKHSLLNRAKVTKKDILNETIVGKYDIIVSNPPYINDEDYENLMPDVKNFEPEIALLSKDDELRFYKRIVDAYYVNLKEGGKLYFEVGYNQSEAVREYMKDKFTDIEIIKDLSGIGRVVKGIGKQDV